MGKIVSIHSFRGGTGKSNTTANLAAQVALAGKRVGVVDTDIQSPGIHVLFGLNEEKMGRTLNEFLNGDCSILSSHTRTLMNTNSFGARRIVGEQDLTVSTTAVGFTSTNYIKSAGSARASDLVKANLAFVTVDAQPIRWSIVGTPQAGSAGHVYASGTNFWLVGHDAIVAFKAIRTGGTDGVLHVTFFA
jgi:cellulose biosynthesis protein BcsQ